MCYKYIVDKSKQQEIQLLSVYDVCDKHILDLNGHACENGFRKKEKYRNMGGGS